MDLKKGGRFVFLDTHRRRAKFVGRELLGKTSLFEQVHHSRGLLPNVSPDPWHADDGQVLHRGLEQFISDSLATTVLFDHYIRNIAILGSRRVTQYITENATTISVPFTAT